MNHLLRAPEGCTSASVEGRAVEIKDGVCEVDTATKAVLLSHGFKEFTPGGTDDPRPPSEEADPYAALKRVTINSINVLDRKDLFTLAKHYGILFPATLKTEQMREALCDHVNKVDEPGKKMLEAAREQLANSAVTTELDPKQPVVNASTQPVEPVVPATPAPEVDPAKGVGEQAALDAAKG